MRGLVQGTGESFWVTCEPGLEGDTDQPMQRAEERLDHHRGLGCRARRAQRAAPCDGDMKAADRDVDGPILTKRPF